MILALVAILLLAAFLPQWRESSTGMSRWVAICTAIGLIEAALLPHWTLSLLLVSLLVSLYRLERPSDQLEWLHQVVLLTGIYLLVYPYVSIPSIEYLLWALLIVGLGISLQALVEALRKGTGELVCGQLNANYFQAALCLSTAAAVGLGQWWALPFILWPVGWVWWRKRTFNQSVLHLSILTCVAMVHEGLWWDLASGAVIVAMATFTWQVLEQSDSGRLAEWKAVMRTWRAYWFGHGPRSWGGTSQTLAIVEGRTQAFSMAHNEYLQHLYEYGVVGLATLLLVCVHVLNTAYATSHGLFLVMVVMGSIALVSFPWAFYHRWVIPVGVQDGQLLVSEGRYGSPLLLWVTFLLVLLGSAT